MKARAARLLEMARRDAFHQHCANSHPEAFEVCVHDNCRLVREAPSAASGELHKLHQNLNALVRRQGGKIDDCSYVECAVCDFLRAALHATPAAGPPHHKLDTDSVVYFYEQEFYVLSNFSAFNLQWKGHVFATSEAAYHWEKFDYIRPIEEQQGVSPTTVKYAILGAPSAHVAFKLAEEYRSVRRPNWDAIKVDVMRGILRAKADQHEYVRRKLLQTGDRQLVEDSWRDDFWGWGPNKDGQNMLGRLWMEIRAELRDPPVSRP